MGRLMGVGTHDPIPMVRGAAPEVNVRIAHPSQNAIYEWKRRSEPSLPQAEILNALLICHGNICTSPLAEALPPS